MKPKSGPTDPPPCEEGPAAATRFERAMRTIVGVTKDELQSRDAAWRKRSGAKRRAKAC